MQIAFVFFDVNTGYAPSLHHGLAYLFGALGSAGHQVVLFHVTTDAEMEAAARQIQVNGFPIVALSIVTNQKRHAKRFLAQLATKPKLLVAGGVHTTLVKEEAFLDFARLDGVCIGEGEGPLLELVDRFAQDLDVTMTAGFYFRRGDQIIKNPVPPLQAVDNLSPPDYSPFNVAKIVHENAFTYPMMLGRGCPYTCSYCCNHAIRAVYPNTGQYVRLPSVSRAMATIKSNLLLVPETKRIVFSDDTFTFNKTWLSEFCETYRKDIGLPFICNARVETICEQSVDALKAAGCVSIDFGVETGNEWLRYQVLSRRHSNQKIREAFALVQKKGIRTFSFNIVGLPLETKEMAKDTLRLNREIRPNFGKCFYFFPFPGSRIYKLCEELGLLPDDAEEVSGYLEKPVLKQVFMSDADTRVAFEKLQAFFYARLLLSRAPLPRRAERLLSSVMVTARKPLLWAINPTNPNPIVRNLRRAARGLALRYLR